MNQQNKVVWAKMRYCPYWPAKLITDPPRALKVPQKKCCVQFFGTHDYGFIELKDIQSYGQHREKYIRKGRGMNFSEAVAECDEFMANIENCMPSDCVVESVSPIIMKKERDVEIKHENPEDCEFYTREPVSTCLDCQQKQDEIMIFKTQNEKIQSEISRLKTAYNQSKFETEQAKAELAKANEKFESEMLRNMKAADQMKNEIKELQKKAEKFKHFKGLQEQNHQIVLQLTQKNQSPKKQLSSLQPNTEYEVEKLLNHNVEDGKQLFLVKWKNYDHTYNSWEPRNNLQCNRILKNYLKKNNLKY